MIKLSTLLVVFLMLFFTSILTAEVVDITDLLGVISAQYDDSPPNETIDRLIDNIVETKYLTFHDAAWVQFDLDKPAMVTSYSITSANDYPERDPSTWEFLGWDDTKNEWVVLDNRKGESEWGERFQTREFTFNNAEYYNSYRLNVLAAHGAGLLQMAEWEIFGDVDDLTPDITNLMGDITVSNAIHGDTQDTVGSRFLIDNNISTKYSVNSDTITIVYGIDQSTLVNAYALVSADDKPEGDPSSWEFQGWDEESAAWVTLHTVTDEPQWDTRLTEKRFSFDNADVFSKYRLQIKAAHGANLIQIAEYRIFGDFFESDVTDITDLQGVHISEANSDSPENEGIEKLIDNNVATKYLTFNDTTWIQITTPNKTVVTDYVLVSGNDAPERDPSTWELEAWDELTESWVTLHAVVDEPQWQARINGKKFSFDNTIPYMTYRLNIHAAHGAGMIQISELYLNGTVLEQGSLVDITDWMGRISESNFNSPEAEQVENLVDNNVNSKYLTFATTTTIEYSLQRQSIVTSYALYSANDAPSRDPKDWTFEAMNPYTLEWETLHTVRNHPTWEERFQKKEFTFKNTQSYNVYRLNITSEHGDGMIQIAELEINGELLSAVEEAESHSPNDYALYQNYPNPFNPSTHIQFSLPRPMDVTISIYNMMGQRVKIVVDEPMSAGLHNLFWNGSNDFGLTVANGIYYIRMNSDLGVKMKKMMFLK